MHKVVLRVLIYVGVAVGLIYFYVKYLEANSIFFPTKELEVKPADYNLDPENIYLKTQDDIVLHGWFFSFKNTQHTMLFFHGNGGNISHRLEKLLFLKQAKTNIFIIDYRGYGKSKGKPTEKGVYLDAQAAYDYLRNERKIKSKRIILYGESLGGAVAIDLASQVDVKALIVEGTFSSGKDMGKILYPYVPKFIFPNVLDSITKIRKINVPKLFIHSVNDEVVPFELGKKLYEQAPFPKQFVETASGHDTAFIDSKEKYINTIIKFIKSLD